MVDADGKFTYSRVIIVKVNDVGRSFKIFPNPAKGFVTITGKNLQQVKLFDASGKLELNQRLLNQSSVTISIGNLSKGIYIVELKDMEGNRETKKLRVY